MTKIIHALIKLLAAVPGATHVSVHQGTVGGISFSAATDEAAAHICELLGFQPLRMSHEDKRWVGGGGSIDGVYVSVMGPHRTVTVGAALDASAVDKACQAAGAAVA